MQLGGWVELKVVTPEGKVRLRKRFKSRSYVLAMIDLLYVQVAYETTGQNILDTGNVSRAMKINTTYGYRNFNSNAAATDATLGIVIGTNSAAVAISNYALGALIAHGTGAGQMSYTIQTFVVPSTSGSIRRFNLIRTFNNSSGNSITVNECGIYVRGAITATDWYFCIARDIVSGGAAVPNGDSLIVTYTLSVTA